MSREQSFTEHELVEGIRNNSRDVLQYLYREMAPVIYRDVVRYHGSKEDAEDHFHEVMIQIGANVKSGKYQEGNICGYIRKVAKNLWINKLRQKKIEVSWDEYESFEPVDEWHYDHYLELKQYEQKMARIKDELENMGETCQGVLKAYYYQQRSLNKIAELYNWTYQYCKKKMYQCRNELKKKIKQNTSLK